MRLSVIQSEVTKSPMELSVHEKEIRACTFGLVLVLVLT